MYGELTCQLAAGRNAVRGRGAAAAEAVEFPTASTTAGHGRPSPPDPDLEALRGLHLPPA
jgi:hypothetical protein